MALISTILNQYRMLVVDLERKIVIFSPGSSPHKVHLEDGYCCKAVFWLFSICNTNCCSCSAPKVGATGVVRLLPAVEAACRFGCTFGCAAGSRASR